MRKLRILIAAIVSTSGAISVAAPPPSEAYGRLPAIGSAALHAKLLHAGKQVQYVEPKGDDHWLSSASTRTLMLREIETFLERHLAAKSDQL